MVFIATHQNPLGCRDALENADPQATPQTASYIKSQLLEVEPRHQCLRSSACLKCTTWAEFCSLSDESGRVSSMSCTTSFLNKAADVPTALITMHTLMAVCSLIILSWSPYFCISVHSVIPWSKNCLSLIFFHYFHFYEWYPSIQRYSSASYTHHHHSHIAASAPVDLLILCPTSNNYATLQQTCPEWLFLTLR